MRYNINNLVIGVQSSNFIKTLHFDSSCEKRSMRCYRDAIPAALAAAFTESGTPSRPSRIVMQPPPQSPQDHFPSIWAENTPSRPRPPRVARARDSTKAPAWLAAALGPPSVSSPATPLLVRQIWLRCLWFSVLL